MATSPNYGWAEPDNSSLVKNGAQDIRALGDAIDTSVWNVGYGQAGKNKIINGDFSINQRAFTSVATNATYTFDRFVTRIAGDGTATFTPQTFTPGAAPVAGYEGANFLQVVTASQTTTGVFTVARQLIENVRTFAGQTITVSFWAKAASGTPKVSITLTQNFGSGGSSAVNTTPIGVTLSTSWARYSVTVAIPSISGATIGTSSYLQLNLCVSAGSSFAADNAVTGIQNNTFQFWGVQVEAGSVATPFQTATGTIQGELAACQRYFNRLVNKKSVYFGVGACTSTTFAQFAIPYPYMRTTPALTVSAVTDFLLTIAAGSGAGAISAISLNSASNESVAKFEVTCASGLVAGNATTLLSQNANATFDLSAEL